MPHSFPGPSEDPIVVEANPQACGFSNEEPTLTWKIIAMRCRCRGACTDGQRPARQTDRRKHCGGPSL